MVRTQQLTHYVWDDRAERSAAGQMAIDRALVDIALAGNIVVQRLYRWTAPTVSFGTNEAARRTWDRSALERALVAVVRRPTGGRGVWHDPDDLTYSVTGPLAAWGSLAAAYQAIHGVLAGALSTIAAGVTIAAATRRPTLAPGACFELAVGGEVLVEDRKVIGSAQAAIGPGLLQHGAIAIHDRAQQLGPFRISSPAADKGVFRASSLAAAPVATTILERWIERGAAPIPADLTEAAMTASGTWEARYADLAWTWRR